MKRVMQTRDADETTGPALLADIASGLHVPRRIVSPVSWAGHIPFASWIVHALRPRTVVELGVHTGNSFFTFAEAAVAFGVDSRLYGIDTWAGDDHAGAYAEEVYVDVSHVAHTRFPDRVHLLRKLFDEAIDDFADGSIDLLHIDGLHTYEAVRHDFESWRPKLSDRAVVLFHDIAVVEPGFGVARFWSEIQLQFPSISFTHSNGLGVLLFGDDVPSGLSAFANPGPLKSGFVELFGKLGDFLLRTIQYGPEAGTLPVNAFLDPPSIYAAIDGEFDEAGVVQARPSPGLPGTLHAVLPPVEGDGNVVLRIDPTSHFGIRAVHRVVLVAEGQGAPVELVAASDDKRERLTIVPLEMGFAFLATGEDSQWYPRLDDDAVRLLRAGATIVFEPIAAPVTALSRMLIASSAALAAPLEKRLAELSRLEELQLLPTFADAVIRIEELEASLSEARARELDTASTLSATEDRLAGSEHRFHESEGRRAETEGRLVDAEGRLVVTEARLATSEARLVEIEARLVETEASLGENAAKLGTSEAGRVESEARRAESEERLREMEARLSDAEGRTSAAESRLLETSARLEAAVAEVEAAHLRADRDAAASWLASQRNEVLRCEIETLRGEVATLESIRFELDGNIAAQDAVDAAIGAFDAAGSTNQVLTAVQVEAKLRALEKLSSDKDAGVSRIGTILGDLFRAVEVAKGRLVAWHARPGSLERRARIGVGQTRLCVLEPASGLAPLDHSGERWHATDSDPQFSFAELVLHAGQWIALTIGIAADERAAGGPTLYFDVGEGMTEATKMEIPRPSSNLPAASIVFYVPVGLKGARFDPCSSPIEFVLEPVRIEVISKWQAMRRMAQWMAPSGRLERLKATHLPQWRSWRMAAARQRLKQAFVDEYRQSLSPPGPDYAGWIELFEPARSSYPSLAAERKSWARQPLISVVMPTYDTPAEVLREAIQSVIDQNYPFWELCIADDASRARHMRPLLEAFAKSDARIKVTYRPVNGHISAASNSALELATGDFIALLDHDDVLHPLALHYVAEAMVANPSAKLIYTDEDKLDRDGIRRAPYFKCDFNPELFLAQNLVTHLGCYDTALVREIGGFRVGLEGSQDWDLALRVYEAIDRTQIVHVPRVLYHWRELAGSTALAIDQKPYIQSASRRAVEDHLKRRRIDARVTPAPGLPMWNRVRYANPSQPHVTIVVPTRDKVEVLRKAVDSVLALTTYPHYDIVIVDNGSVETETLAYLASLPTDRVRVIRDDSPFNYSRINNDAVRQSTGELICLLNNDVEAIDGDWLDEMVSMASGDSVGIVGARLWYPDMRLQHGGVILGIGGVAGHAHRLTSRAEAGYFGRAVLHQQLSAVTGACLLIKRSVWDAIGGLDEKLGVAFNDIDLCLRAGELGFRTVWTPYAELIHYESISRGAEDTPEKILRFNTESALMRARWGARLLNDPFYSPNLTLVAEDFSISWQPRQQAVARHPASDCRTTASHEHPARIETSQVR